MADRAQIRAARLAFRHPRAFQPRNPPYPAFLSHFYENLAKHIVRLSSTKVSVEPRAKVCYHTCTPFKRATPAFAAADRKLKRLSIQRSNCTIPICFREEHFMPPLYVLSFQRSKLENAYLSSVSPAEDLLTMSQNLDLMIVRAQRMRKASFRSLPLRAVRPRQLRASLITPFL